MAKTSSSFNQSSSYIMQMKAGVWENEDTKTRVMKKGDVRTKALPLFPEHHDGTDSHVVPDEDDIIYEPQHDYYSQVPPKVAKRTTLFDLEKPPASDHDDDDDASFVYTLINSKRPEAADYKDLVVPHHHAHCESKSAAPPSKLPNEAEEALVPCFSVCSNDPHQDQDQVQSVKEEQALTNNHTLRPPKRKHARARTTEKLKINKKMRTLQGLIPNCNNKVDKASILDDAIVYVKALQFQLQIMSMPPMHLSYPMLGFPPFVPMPTPLLVPHPSISLSNSISSNLSNHLLKHHQR